MTEAEYLEDQECKECFYFPICEGNVLISEFKIKLIQKKLIYAAI